MQWVVVIGGFALLFGLPFMFFHTLLGAPAWAAVLIVWWMWT